MNPQFAFALNVAGFFLRSPEDKAAIRAARATDALLATPEAREALAAWTALAKAVGAADTAPSSVQPTTKIDDTNYPGAHGQILR